jgi:hypothetical protein
MTRRLFNLATALSLLLSVAVVVLWVRSYFRLDEFRFGTANGWLTCVCSYDGRLQFLSLTGWPRSEPPRWRSALPETDFDYRPSLPPAVDFSAAAGDIATGTWSGGEGVGHGYARCRTFYSTDGTPAPVGKFSYGPSVPVGKQRITVRWRTINHWTLTWALLVLPALWLVQRGTRRAARYFLMIQRGAAGRCLSCGYNLTGNTSGVCPECGTAAAAENPPTEVMRTRSVSGSSTTSALAP